MSRTLGSHVKCAAGLKLNRTYQESSRHYLILELKCGAVSLVHSFIYNWLSDPPKKEEGILEWINGSGKKNSENLARSVCSRSKSYDH